MSRGASLAAPGAQSHRPPCPHFPDCVGCVFAGMAYGAQLRAKRERVVRALAAYPQLAAVAVPAVIGAPQPFGYRNQAKLVARRARRGVLLGVYRPGTHQVVDISACPVHRPPIPAVLAGVRRLLEQREVPIYDERRRSGWLRYLIVRSSAWQRSAQCILVVRDRGWPGERALLRELAGLRSVAGVALNLNPEPGNRLFGERFVRAAGAAALLERVAGLTLQSSPGAFLQANIAVAQRLYEQVCTWAAPARGATAVDLYAGVGAIALLLARRAERVIGVEESPIAVRDARENARRNGCPNVRFFAAPAAEGLAAAAARLGRVDLLTLNPPRAGADEGCRRAVAACAPARIVYLSCNPTTLARDLDWWLAHGYALGGLRPYDLLPQTDHVETVAMLRRLG